MKYLRQCIRQLILEWDATPWEETEEGKEYLKYHDDDRAEAALQEIISIFEDAGSFRAGPWGHEFDVYEMYYRPEAGCEVRIRVYRMWGGILFDELETSPSCENKGYGRKVVSMIKDIAKKHRVIVKLQPNAFNTHKSENRMSSHELEDWYESQGFKQGDGSYMEYKW